MRWNISHWRRKMHVQGFFSSSRHMPLNIWALHVRKVNISQMRYRGREDICHKTTDEARPESDEFSFTKGLGFLGLLFLFFAFLNFVIIQITSSLENVFWVLKRNIRRHYFKHKASIYAVNIYLCISGLFCRVQCSSVAFWYAVNLSFSVIPADLKYCSVGYNRKKTTVSLV